MKQGNIISRNPCRLGDKNTAFCGTTFFKRGMGWVESDDSARELNLGVGTEKGFFSDWSPFPASGKHTKSDGNLKFTVVSPKNWWFFHSFLYVYQRVVPSTLLASEELITWSQEWSLDAFLGGFFPSRVLWPSLPQTMAHSLDFPVDHRFAPPSWEWNQTKRVCLKNERPPQNRWTAGRQDVFFYNFFSRHWN